MNRQQEVEATDLALQILMPEEQFTHAWKLFNDTKKIAELFMVSESAVTMRAVQLFGEFMP